MPAKGPSSPPPASAAAPTPPLLLVDIDGVVSLFGFSAHERPAGVFHAIDGIPHLLSTAAARHLLDLVSVYELVWCSGWEEKAEEYLPHLLGLPRGLPFLSFERDMRGLGGAGGGGSGESEAGEGNGIGDRAGGNAITRAHWKLEAIDSFAGPDRPLAWIDDAFNAACHDWAAARGAPTLLVQTEPSAGLTEREAVLLRDWAPAPG